jgi:hypothetical protein
MKQKSYLKMLLITAFVIITLGGFLLHTRIHTPAANHANTIPFFTGLSSILVLSVMFAFRKSIPYAYIMNGMLVIIGSITMAHFSIIRWKGGITLENIFLKSLFGDILILWTSLFIGKLIFDLENTTPPSLETDRHKGRFLRYPNMGYWVVHTVSLSVVYALGHFLWK